MQGDFINRTIGLSTAQSMQQDPALFSIGNSNALSQAKTMTSSQWPNQNPVSATPIMSQLNPASTLAPMSSIPQNTMTMTSLQSQSQAQSVMGPGAGGLMATGGPLGVGGAMGPGGVGVGNPGMPNQAGAAPGIPGADPSNPLANRNIIWKGRA